METLKGKKLLGINGLGRIGKLTLWYHLQSRYFEGAVVNVGREVGKNLEDLIRTIDTDSTYGSLSRFLYGMTGKTCDIHIIDADKGMIEIDGFPVTILRKERNPKNIGWHKEGVKVVVDCTGKFLDPTVPADDPKGSLRGHLDAGARKVIASAPFKIKDSAKPEPSDSPTLIYGINHLSFMPREHHIISAASCTTTGLAHMMKPLLDDEETARILTASMSTVHAATNTQSVLDAVPSTGASDLRKNRSVMNNIILSTTGAGKALEKVLPQISQIGLMADSVRIPTSTVSLITLNITFHSRMNEFGEPAINKAHLDNLYQKAAEGSQKGLLFFSQRQNVSSDMIGLRAAVVVEGHETHTRTGLLQIPSSLLEAYGLKSDNHLSIPVTHAKLFGWYDNEFGSYVYCLGKLTEYIEGTLAC